MITDRLLHEIISIALAAGDIIMDIYGGPVEVKTKDDSSPVTLADEAAEKHILAALKALTPNIPVVAEESVAAGAIPDISDGHFWLVDPLDGTKEFINRTDEFTVNIALIDGGEPLLGVVVAPASGLLYYARTGDGAWKREGDGAPERLRSTLADPSGPLRIVESRSHPSPALEVFLEPFTIAERVKSGSSLKFCVVADGRADVYPRLGPTMEWDVAAGDCVYRNSGHPKPHPGTLRYNKPSLKNGSFVIGLAPGTYELPDDERSQESENRSQKEV